MLRNKAADMLEGAGLEGHTQFATSQLPSACGYLAAGWVVVRFVPSLPSLGLGFMQVLGS